MTRSDTQNPASEDVSSDSYESIMQEFLARRRLAHDGKIVIKGKERPYRESVQGTTKFYLHPKSDAALQDWRVFQKDIRQGTGKHRHQGGLVIYITQGKGYSVFDGVRLEWKQGDLLSLPIKPNGIEHQHFTYPGDEQAQWVAFIYIPFLHATGSMLEQIEDRSTAADAS
jgi:hypothetical protein